MPDLDPTPTLDEFPPATFEQWRALAERTLGAPLAERTTEGVTTPIFRPDDDRPGPAHPLTTHATWRVAQELALSDPAHVAAALREGGGLQLAWIPIVGHARAGCRVAAPSPGLPIPDPATLRSIIDAARASGVTVMLHADASAGAIVQAWRSHAPDLAGLAGVLADPLAALAELGARDRALDDAYAAIATTTRTVIEAGSDAATLLASGVPYHDAGAEPAVELGVAIAAALCHLRGLQTHGIAPNDAAPRMGLRLALGRDVFITIAKLRAARRLWAAIAGRLGLVDTSVRIWARTSWRSTTRLDLPVNLVRHTLQAFAGAVAGVEHICVQPHTEATETSDADARRWAKNVLHILRGEARLDCVADPAAGSAHVEHLTQRLAERAWTIAQRLATGDPDRTLASALQRDDPALTCEIPEQPGLVGVDRYPDPKPPAPRREHAAEHGDGAAAVTAPPLSRQRLAARIEDERSEASR